MKRECLMILAVAAAPFASSRVLCAGMESGPKAGYNVPALKAFGVVGTVVNKETDFTAARKAAPTIYLFVQSEHWDRPMARFLRTLDGKLGDVDNAAAVAVWLGEKKADEHKEYLPRAQMSLSLQNTDLTVFEGDRTGPEGWNVNTDAHLTVVIVLEGKVVKSIGFVSVNETDVKGVIEALTKAVGK